MKTPYRARKTTILIEGLHLQARVGVPAVERASPQNVVLDACITLKQPRIASDTMKDSVSYKTVVMGIQDLVRTQAWSLLETMAEAVAGVCFQDKRVDYASIRICKLRRFPECEAVGVERVFTGM